MKFKYTVKKLLILVSLVILLGAAMMGADYWRVRTYKKPVFAICTNGYNGGSGTYTGIGYNIDIQGNFMPEDRFPGVTRAEFYIFGNKIVELFVIDQN